MSEDGAPQETLDNEQIAKHLREAGDLLALQQANPFRVDAYRQAAETVRGLRLPIATIYREEGFDGLVELPTIGKGIAAAVAEMLTRRRWQFLERLRGSEDPLEVLQRVPGVGPALAQRFHEELGIDDLDELEQAISEGEVEALSGVGEHMVAGFRAALEGIHAQPRGREATHGPEPCVGVLLGVDAEYRRKAEADELPKIAPQRHNPAGERWLPVLHTQRGEWHFSALFSNTARAHRLGKTRDWVVLYWYDDEHDEGQHTVVTETRPGILAERRVVRGRESSCVEHYTRAEAE